jgi:transcriptional regulator with XRE-family HTH domain
VVHSAAPARSVTVVTNFPSGNMKETEPGSFGWRLRRWREEARLTQTELADKLGWGQNVISRYELNVSAPVSPERQQALDAALGLEPGTIEAMVPRRVSRQGGAFSSSAAAAFFENLTEEEKRMLLEAYDRMERERELRRRERDREAG